MKTTPDQLSLPLFDTTALGGSMGLYSGLSYGEPVDDSITDSGDDAPAPIIVPARNFRLKGARRLSPDWKTRAADNIAAIRLMLKIEEEARNATPEEQGRLALFTSFGAGELANNLFRRSAEEAFPKGWEALGEDLEQLVSPGELASLARVTQYAHFTPEFMVRAIWRALRRMGFSGGRVLEPGCGTGLFFALMPETLEAKTTLTGVEMDPITARITKLLHPNARIRAEDFTRARIAETYDLVVGKGSDGIPARHARIIRGLVQIRDAVRNVLRAQEADLPWGGAQVRLRAAYAHFKREFGPINLTTISKTKGPDGESHETVRRPNLQPFLDDPDVWLVSSIED
jgi:hypothetical protein